jgi:transcriptional regulator with XRE-family HTH domain
VTAEELRRAAIVLFGERGWMSRLAEALGVDRSSVSRWFAGLPVPGPVAAAMTAWMALFELTGCPAGQFKAPTTEEKIPGDSYPPRSATAGDHGSF